MKKSILLFAVCITPCLYAQQTDDWVLQNPSSLRGGSFSAVETVGSAKWAVGWGGLILHKPSGSNNWVERYSGVVTVLRDVCMAPDGQNGWIVGNRGTILRTTDAGVTWDRQHPTHPSYIAEITDCTAQTATVRSSGYGMATNDGGASWSRGGTSGGHYPFFANGAGPSFTDVPGQYTMRDIHFVDTRKGWVVGSGGMLQTTDGGSTWSAVTLPTGVSSLRAIHFGSATHGWAVGGTKLIHTSNGGTSWAVQTVTGNPQMNGVFFVSATVGYVVGPGKGVYRTADGGATWASKSGGQNNEGVHFADANRGWITGVGYTGSKNNSAIYRTTNGGTSWSKTNTGAIPDGIIVDVHFVDANNGWAVGWDSWSSPEWVTSIRPVVLKTTNGGSSWSQKAPRGGRDLSSRPHNELYWWSALYGVYFADAMNGWVVGKSGRGGLVMHTTDGGSTWTTLLKPPGWFYAVHGVSGATWIAGDHGRIYKATGAGTTVGTGIDIVHGSLELPARANNSAGVGSSGRRGIDYDGFVFTVLSSTQWTITKSAASWVTGIFPTSGHGTQIVRITNTTNTGGDRSVTFTVTATSGAAKDITIIQKGPILNVAPTFLRVGPFAGDIAFTVTSNTSWTVTRPASDTWITSLSTGAGSSGIRTVSSFEDNTVTINYEVNNGVQRTAELTISGVEPARTVRLLQLGVPAASLIVEPTAATLPDGSGTFPVRVSSNVAWEVTPDVDWLTVVPTADVGSNHAVMVSHTDRPGGVENRTGVLTFSSVGESPEIVKLMTLTQGSGGGAPPPPPPPPETVFAITPTGVRNIGGSAGSEAVAVVSGGAWTAMSDVPWLTPSPGRGTTTSAVRVSYTRHTASAPREGRITFSEVGESGAEILTFRQSNVPPSLSVAPSGSQSTPVELSGGQGTQRVSVVSSVAWAATANVEWITPLPAEGSGSNSNVFISYTPNPSSEAMRRGQVTFTAEGARDVIFYARQATGSGRSGPSISLESGVLVLEAAVGDTTIQVTHRARWDAEIEFTGQRWFTVAPMNSPAPSQSPTSFTVDYQVNGGGMQRRATITFEGDDDTEVPLLIIQNPARVVQRTFFVRPEDDINTAGSPGSTALAVVSLVVGSNRWTVRVDPPTETWLRTMPSGGDQTSPVLVSWDANNSGDTREATLVFSETMGTGTESIFVTQTDEPASIRIMPSEARQVPAGQGQLRVSVLSNVSWSVSSSAPTWLDPLIDRGTGDEDNVFISYLGNPTTSPRSGILTFSSPGISAPPSLTINQDAGTGEDLPPLTVTPDSKSLTNEEGMFVLVVSATVDWSVRAASIESWLEIDPASGGVGSENVMVSHEANTDVGRDATLIFEGSDGSVKSVAITQREGVDMSGSLTVTPRSVRVRREAGSVDLSVSSRVNWTAQVLNERWLRISPSFRRGLDGMTAVPTTVTIRYFLNDGDAEREANIIFNGEDGTQRTVLFTQTLEAGGGSGEGGLTALTGSEDAFGFRIYPVPVDHVLYMESDEDDVDVRVYDEQGALCGAYRLQGTGYREAIDVESYQAGVYMIVARARDGRVVRRFLRR